MADVMELPKSRINASLLAQFIDRPVCFVGRLEKVRALAALGSPVRSRWEGPVTAGRPRGGVMEVEGGQKALDHHCPPDCFILHKGTFCTVYSHCSPILAPLLWREIAMFSNALRSKS